MSLSSYQGEEIITSVIIKGGKKTYEKKYFPRTVFNDPQGKDAYIIGNGESRIDFDLYSLPQDTYGCNALYRDYEPDYLIVVDQHMYKEILESGYGEKNIVYTNHLNMSRYGGVSHLIPNNPHKGTGTTAVHIALHDGHTKLFLLGFDNDANGKNNNVYKNTNAYNDDKTEVHQTIWGRQIFDIMKSRPDVHFTFVGGSQYLPEPLPNYKKISYQEFENIING